jgi:uncharacterized protein (TIGR02391 family)
MDEVKGFLEKAKNLRNESHDSPKVDLFVSRLKRFLKQNCSDEYAKIVDDYFQVFVVTSHTDFQELHRESIDKTVEFLNDLIEADETPPAHGGKKEHMISDDLINLHPKILASSQKLFRDEHYREAVGNAIMVVKDRLRDITGFENGYPAFEKGGLYIKGALANNVDPDFQEAVKWLLGAIDKFRNEKFHTSEKGIDDKLKALSYLHMCNLAMMFLDGDHYSTRVVQWSKMKRITLRKPQP